MVWDEESVSKYKEILEQESSRQMFENFNDTDFISSDDAVAEFTNIMKKILLRVFPDKRKSKRARTARYREHFSHACQVAKRAFKQAQRHLNANILDVNRRHKLIIERRNYRKAIYAAKRIEKVK